jgi:hypothetical protein
MVLFCKSYHLGFMMSVYDELVALCRDMHAAGEPLTYAALLGRRGGGSRRDIARALQAWRLENPDGPRAVPGRPSRVETRLRDIIRRQREAIHDQAETIRILHEDTESLGRMVRRFRPYPEDELPLEEPS